MAHIDGLIAGKWFDIAEIGNGSVPTKGAIAFPRKDSYGQFNRLRHDGAGVIHQGKF